MRTEPMVEDKQKPAAPPVTSAVSRRALPALLLVAVGAMLGGAGVVFASPPRPEPLPAPQKPPEMLAVQHPDQLEFTFNPRTEAGKAYASVSFYFVYEVREDREDAAFEAIRANWDRATSNVLMLLSARSIRELNSGDGKTTLARDLVDELDATLFPGRGGPKLARVSEVLWSKFMLQ